MSTAYECALAIAMLVAPPGTPEVVPSTGDWPAMQAALHETAIAWQILDSRETRYVLARVEDFEADLNLLRRRYVDLKDAPLVEDSTRFPNRAHVNELVRFNRAFRKHLEERSHCEYDRQDVLTRAIKDCDQLYNVWDAVRDSRCEFYYITVRRTALKKLRSSIGEEDYAAGKLPEYVPEWAFIPIK